MQKDQPVSEPKPERCETLALPPEVRRVVVLGDPHGDLIALDLVLGLEAGPETLILSAGDNVGYADATLSSYLCELLAAKGIRSVRGNHEAWSEEGELFQAPPGRPRQLSEAAWAYCEGLPHRIRLEAPGSGRSIALVHSLPGWAYVNANQTKRLLDVEEADLVFCGHTHRPAIYSLKRGNRRARVARLDVRKPAPVRVELDPELRYVVDAGSLARPSAPRVGMVPTRGSYALLDLDARAIELRSVDKEPRLRQLLEDSLQRPPE